jgi:serine/threonine protein phosphatase PrpC
LEIAYLTHPGMVRESNEDSLFVDNRLGLFIVADGMGGHKAGGVASAMAVKVVSQLVRTGIGGVRDPETLLRDSLLAAHEAVLALARSDNALCDMGTTIVAALLTNDQLTIGHVGDSRAYAISEGQITQLTQDHSFIAEWIRDGIISKLEARTHKARHGLTMALGVDDDMDPDLCRLAWHETSCLLLCSDGLTDMLDDKEVLSLVDNAPSLHEACRELVATANEKGGEDNISVVLVRN